MFIFRADGKHEGCFRFGDCLVVVLTDHQTLHLRESGSLFQAMAFKSDRRAHRKGIAIADVAPGGEAFQPLQKEPVGHHIIECAEYDPAMDNTVIATVMFPGREARMADIAFNSKVKLQPDGVRGPADKTMVGV